MERLVNKIHIGINVSKAKLNIKYGDESSVIVIENKKQAFKSLKQYFPKDTLMAGCYCFMVLSKCKTQI